MTEQAVEPTEVQAPATVDPATVVREMIDRQAPAFKTVLPAHVDPDRFSRLVLAAVKATPQLMECFATSAGQMSVLMAAMEAATVGLDPNTPTQDAWILPRKNKGVLEAELVIGYRGLIKLARRSGAITSISGATVREHDHFDYAYGLTERLEHIPAPAGQRGDRTHAWAAARFRDGGHAFVVLDRDEVMARRDASPSAKSSFSPWVNWEDAMWRKSAIRALSPFLPLETEVARAMSLDEQPIDTAPLESAFVPALEAGD